MSNITALQSARKENRKMIIRFRVTNKKMRVERGTGRGRGIGESGQEIAREGAPVSGGSQKAMDENGR